MSYDHCHYCPLATEYNQKCTSKHLLRYLLRTLKWFSPPPFRADPSTAPDSTAGFKILGPSKAQ